MTKLITPDMATDDLFALSGLEVMGEDDGLNAGNETEEEINQVIFKPYEFGNDFISEHIGTITAMENKINDLFYLANAIESAKGMNQTFAMEAEKIIPNFGGVSIGYYSKDTSATRYKLSLEEISAGVWALIAAAVTAIITMIIKFISWAFGSSSSDSSKKSSVTAGSFKAEEKKREEIIDIIKDIDKAVSKEGLDIDKILAEYVKKADPASSLSTMLTVTDPLFHDVMTNGPYFTITTHAIKGCGNIMSYQKDIESQYVELDKLYNETKLLINTKGDAKDDVPIREQLDTIRAIGAVDSKLPLMGSGDDGIMYIYEYNSKVIDARRKATSQHSTTYTSIVFTKLYETFNNIIGSSNLKYILEEMHFNENAAKSLEALLKKFVTGVSAASSNTNTSSLSNAVNTANSNLMAHIHASITYLKYVIEYFNVLRNIDIKIRTVVKAALNIVKGEMKNKEGVDMTNFKELHDKLLEIDKRPE
jgi:hypothetical protein